MREVQGWQEMNNLKPPIERAAERITDHNVAMRSFLLRMLDPEDLGLAVTNEVRELARKLVNMPRKGEPNA
jgi:hypothetical protein